jgi:glycosyltransferase involved in cell wall biosynthesis
LAQGLDFRLVMAGTGVDVGNTTLVDAIANAGLRDRVHLLGERSDVASVLSGLDIYVSASNRLEGFSNAVGEAMSCGLPCVVTAVGDSALIVGDTGIVVPPGDASALASAMARWVGMHPADLESLGQSARQRVHAEYDIEVVAQRYAALYESLVRQRQRAASAPA